MRISDWSSDVCSSDLIDPGHPENDLTLGLAYPFDKRIIHIIWMLRDHAAQAFQHLADCLMKLRLPGITRSEEHAELQSLMRISYAVFCLKKKKTRNSQMITNNPRYNMSNYDIRTI